MAIFMKSSLFIKNLCVLFFQRTSHIFTCLSHWYWYTILNSLLVFFISKLKKIVNKSPCKIVILRFMLLCIGKWQSSGLCLLLCSRKYKYFGICCYSIATANAWEWSCLYIHWCFLVCYSYLHLFCYGKKHGCWMMKRLENNR